KGIEPDIEVEQAKVEALGPERGTHEADLRGALSNPDDKKNSPEQLPAETQGVQDKPAEKPAEPSAATEQKPEDKETFVGSERQQIARPSEDYQLARALDLLRGLSLLQKQAAN